MLPARAAKVLTLPARVTQSDGTSLVVYGHGDENLSWYTTEDGVLLAHVGDAYYIAATQADGTLAATGQIAHEREQRTAAEQSLAAAQDREAFLRGASALSQRRLIPIGTSNPPYFPHTGTPRALVVLVEFADVKFQPADPQAVFARYLNGTAATAEQYGATTDMNYGSVAQYFRDMSGGQFVPQFDVTEPVTMPQNLAYYGGNASQTVKDVRIQEMIKEACTAVDGDVDFSTYDADGDGTVDLVYIVYAGYSESVSGNSTDCIWPKSGLCTLNATFDGKTVRRYGVSNELYGKPGTAAPYINGIGLFCHEFSHTLGLPDLYPTVSTACLDNQGMEYWSLMDGGEYVNNGFTPTPYTPWEKDVMGWAALSPIAEAGSHTLASGQAVKIEAENGEYLILHNLQKEGWAEKMPGHGMLVYRVDYPHSLVNYNDRPNNTAGKPAVTIVPADGLLYSTWHEGATAKTYYDDHKGDPYPGTANVTEIQSVALNKSTFARPITGITEVGGVVTFSLAEATAISRVPLGVASEDAPVYTLGGVMVGRDAAALPKGVYVRNHKKIVVR